MQKSNEKPITFLFVGLIIFSLLGLEFPVFFLSRMVDGRPVAQTFNWPINWYGTVFHWTVTMLIWAAGTAVIFCWAKKKGLLPKLFRSQLHLRDALFLAAGILVVVIYELALSRVLGLSMPQIWREYLGFQIIYGRQAWMVAVFQNLYYLVEYVLVVMMIAFFQLGGELWLKSTWFPWGGIGLALTWGTIHLVTNPQGAVWVIVFGVMLGLIFVVSRKSFLSAWILGVLAFFL